MDARKVQNYYALRQDFADNTPDWSYWKKDDYNLIINNEDPYDGTLEWPTKITVEVAGDVSGVVVYGMFTGDFNGDRSFDSP